MTIRFHDRHEWIDYLKANEVARRIVADPSTIEDAVDPDWVSDLIDGSIGRYSQFHRTFGYYGDGVSERTAVMPLDWRGRAREYTTPDGLATALCPSAEDIAIAKLCAWREKDQAWLREAFRSGVANARDATTLLQGELPEAAPATDELMRRMYVVAPVGGSPTG